jgi:hypothetical protein
LSGLFFVLNLYPPHQVPLGYLGLALSSVFVWESRIWRRLTPRDYAVLAALLAFAAAVVAFFLRHSLAELEVLSEAVFPGQRRASGGDVPPWQLQRYLMSGLLPFAYPPFANPSELAAFTNLLPAVVLTLPWTLRGERSRRGLVLTLLAFTTVTLAWMLVPFPAWLASATLLDRVPTFRLQLVSELAALYLTIWAVGRAVQERPLGTLAAVLAASGVAVLHAASVVFSPMRDYLGTGALLALVLAFFFLLNASFLLGQLRLFALVLTSFIVVAGLCVNPLARGLSPLYDKVVTRQVQSVAARDPGRLWAARGRGLYGNLLVAAGVRTINGSHTYPDLKLWHRLDPERKHERVYNRHALVALDVIKGSTQWELTDEPSTITVRISLRELAAVGVKYLLSVGTVSPDDATAVRTLYHSPSDDIFIYEISARS